MGVAYGEVYRFFFFWGVGGCERVLVSSFILRLD